MADDGDPLDVMVIHDAATSPGLLLICKVIGVLKIEQRSDGKTERNDRIFAVPKNSHAEKSLTHVSDLSQPMREELEKFFAATDELEDKSLKMPGWKGPRQALKLIEQGAKAFKNRQ